MTLTTVSGPGLAPGEAESRPGHLAALPGGAWALWRTVVLRGAGFPARQVLRLAAPAAAEAADRAVVLEEELEARRGAALRALHEALDELRARGLWEERELRRPLMKAMQALTGGKAPKEDPAPSCAPAFAALRAASADLQAAREVFAAVYQSEVSRVSQEIQGVAREGLFREAVLWQNRNAVDTALDELARPGTAARTSQRRQHEELAASYLQRYCTKNDTIGFFGPVAFSQLVDQGDTVSMRCGDGLLQVRNVYFEAWCIEAVAEVLGKDPALRPWLAPSVKSSFFLEGQLLHRPFGKPLVLQAAQASVLACCDGRTAAEIAKELIADPMVPLATEEGVYRILDDLCRTRVLTWALRVPSSLHPDEELARILARIELQPLRAKAMAMVEEMRRARDGVSRAAGDASALSAALREAEATFTRLTGAAPWHRHGQVYAARGLVYEDCRRDLDVDFGPEILARLGPPLDLVLRSCRWLAGELTRRLDELLHALHAQLRRHTGSEAVDCHVFFTSALSMIFARPEWNEGLAEIESGLQARWARVLGPIPAEARRVRFSVPEIEARFDAAFGEVGPAWTLTRYFSPDVMIAADGEEALQRGDFELILGEIHSGNTLLWSCFIAQHPDPERVSRLLELDTGSEVVIMPQGVQQSTPQRVSPGLSLPVWYEFHFADNPPSEAAVRILPAGALVVEAGPQGLRVRSRDGEVSFHPIDLFSPQLAKDCTDLIGSFLAPGRHQPRVSLGDVIVSRERWHFAASELGFTEIQGPVERFLALRGWVRALGLPRFCFFKVSTERKPCYLDLESPISVDLFARFVRAARKADPEAKVSVSEMTPGLDQLWMRDGAGNQYTCELRMAALELGVPARP